ncbi:uncharacterized protein METZ01_LOCUS344881 [marine metagenome]|uniref:Uncharacterized protein n=1 Tax=marine metagenome TaxID=408172 RepID=A0A382R494_9ZZZZ
MGIVILLVVLIPDRLWTSFNRAHLLGVVILLTAWASEGNPHFFKDSMENTYRHNTAVAQNQARHPIPEVSVR